MADAMHKAGVSMAIYRHEHLLFVFATARDKRSWDELNGDLVTPRWDKYMADILVDDEDGKTFIEDLPQMFAFGDFV